MSKESKDYKNMPKKIYIRTFGCQMNNRDSEFISGLFLEKGYKLNESASDAGVVLFNTCSVRHHAEQRAVSNMGLLMKKHKNKIYGIVGCGAQALKSKLFKRLPGLDIICGTGEIARLPEIVEEAMHRKVLAIGRIDAPMSEITPSFRESDKHAYVSIMRGCDNFCSYCIVPYVRGKERSRGVDDIAGEIEDLAERGIKDITLLGQNVNSYKSKKTNFIGLLKTVNSIAGIESIKFMTSHPKDASTALFKTMQESDKVVKHLHLPLQSGSDRILKLMNRGYASKKYIDLVMKARRIIPGLRLTTDIIVGFPTETEKDFNDTLKCMKKIRFDSAYIFKYSPREGTKASGMKDDVPESAKKNRNNMLLDLQRQISKEKSRDEKNSCLCCN